MRPRGSRLVARSSHEDAVAPRQHYVVLVPKLSKRPLTVIAAATLFTLVIFPVLGASASASSPAAIAHTTGPLAASPTSLSFGSETVGVSSGFKFVTLTNNGSAPDTVNAFTLGGTNPDVFFASDDPSDIGAPGCTSIAPGKSCTLYVWFIPAGLGSRQATVTANDGSASPPVITLSGTGTEGYYETTTQGAVYPHGDAQGFGDTSGTALAAPIVGSAASSDARGYWLVASDGGVFAFGDAAFSGSTGGTHLNQPIVGMAPTGFGGYWLVARDGGVFSYGAVFFGSMGGIHLNKPIVGIAALAYGNGYWLVASDGGVFAFGDAGFYGSTGGVHLNEPIVSVAATPDGKGYWLVAADGGVFAFGDASFYGSTGGIHLNEPIVGIATTATGNGYWLVAADGGVFAFGDAGFYGSSAGASTSHFVGIANG